MIQEYTTGLTENGKGISIMADANNFKSTYQILLEISKVWEKLTDTQQAKLLEGIAGKHRASAVAAILSDEETLVKAYETALNSAGSAMDEFTKRTESIEYHLAQLKATWQEFSTKALSSEFVIKIIDVASAFLELASSLDMGKTILGVVGSIGSLFAVVKVIPALASLGKESLDTSDAIEVLFGKFSATKDEVKKIKKSADDINEAISDVTDEKASENVTKLVHAFVGLKDVVGVLSKLFKGLSVTILATGAVIGLVTSFVDWFKKQKYAVDDLNKSISELEGSISDYTSELNELNSKSYKTEYDLERIQYLKEQIELEQELLRIQKQRLVQQTVSDVKKYVNKDRGGVNSEFQNDMDQLNTDTFNFEWQKNQITDLKKSIDEAKKSMSGLSVESEEYKKKANNLIAMENNLQAMELKSSEYREAAVEDLQALTQKRQDLTDAIGVLTGQEKEEAIALRNKIDLEIVDYKTRLGLVVSTEALSKSIENQKNQLNSLDFVLEKANAKHRITEQELKKLEEQYPDLAKTIKESCEKTTEGYLIEGNALDALNKQRDESKRALIQAEITMTQEAIDNTKTRIAAYQDEISAISGLLGALAAVSLGDSAFEETHAYSDEFYGEGTTQKQVKDASYNITDEQKAKYEEYRKLFKDLTEYEKKITDLQKELNGLGSGGSGGIDYDQDTASSKDTDKNIDVWDKYANALAKMNEEVERYNAAVELTQAKLNLNQSQEERTVDLIKEEYGLYDDLLEAQQARYQIVNDTLWLQMQQLDVLHEQMAGKITAKTGVEIDSTELAKWTDADLEKFAEIHLKVDKSEADADLKNELNYMIEMNESVDDLYVKWYELKQEKFDTVKEIMQSEIDLQDNILEKYDESRTSVEKLLDLLEEVDGTETERGELLSSMVDSYESQKTSIDEMYQTNLKLLAELSKDMKSNTQAYEQMLKQQQKLEEDKLETIQNQYNYKLKQLELEKQIAEQQAESDIYGEQGQDKWEKSREREINALQDQLDALEKENEEDSYEKQLLDYQDEIAEKEEEIAELYKKLDNLRSQKTVQTLKEQEDGSFQWEYVEDQIAINDTLKEIADKQNEIEYTRNEIKELQDEHALEMEKQAIQNKIDAIEEEVGRRQELYDEQLKSIQATYNEQTRILDEWVRKEVANFQNMVNNAETFLANYQKVNVDGWKSATEATSTELTALNEVYSENFKDINNTIANYASQAISHIRAIQAAEAEAREAASKGTSSGRTSSKKAAGGIKFVESNNFPALLHYGERVLTRQEAQQYNELEKDIKSGRMMSFFESAKKDTMNSISSTISKNVGVSNIQQPLSQTTTTSFVIENLELPNVQDSQDFAAVLQSWARSEFGGLAQKAKIIKSK